MERCLLQLRNSSMCAVHGECVPSPYNRTCKEACKSKTKKLHFYVINIEAAAVFKESLKWYSPQFNRIRALSCAVGSLNQIPFFS